LSCLLKSAESDVAQMCWLHSILRDQHVKKQKAKLDA